MWHVNKDMDTDVFFKYLRDLSEAEWQEKVGDTRTVRDVVAHLVGWERECARTLPQVWEKKTIPWFMKTDDYDEFNQKNMDEYRELSFNELLDEWQRWQNVLNEEIEIIGEDDIRKQKGFEWVLDEGDNGHFIEHFNEIKGALNK